MTDDQMTHTHTHVPLLSIYPLRQSDYSPLNWLSPQIQTSSLSFCISPSLIPSTIIYSTHTLTSISLASIPTSLTFLLSTLPVGSSPFGMFVFAY